MPSSPRPVMVGRQDLVDLARRRLAEAAAGHGRFLLFAGEAGIGKTRLLGEIATLTEGFATITAAGYPRDVETAGGMLLDLAAAVTRAGAADLGRQLAQRLGEAPAGDAHRRRRVLVGELTDMVLAVAGHVAPGLLALEDLHWADDLTLEVLERAARHLPDVRVLVVGTYRSDELAPDAPLRQWRARLLTQRLAEEARLHRLSPAQTAELVGAIAATALPGTLTDTVHLRSDGIPLHIEELLSAVAEGGGAGAASVPDTLADAVLARAALLSTAGRRVADAASVIGRTFDLDWLPTVADADAASIDDGLRELADRHFVVPGAAAGTYEFRHALLCDALYAAIAPMRRRALHRRAAEVAVGTARRDAYVSHHFELAGQGGKAYEHALGAAAEASGMSAHREAVELYRRAQRTVPTGADPRQRAELAAALAGELAAVDDNAGAAASYAQAYEAYRALGDADAAARLVPHQVAVAHLLGAPLAERTRRLTEALDDVDTGPGRTEILAALAAAYMLDRRLDESIRYGSEAGAADVATRANVDATVGSVLLFSGRTEEGVALLTGAIERAVAARAESEAARGYRMIASSFSVLVDYERAERWLAEGIAYAGRTERWNDRHYMLAHLAHVRWATGAWDDAERLASQSLADGEGGITTRVTALHVLGFLALGRGDWPGAAGHLDEARAIGEQMGELQRLAPALWGLAEAALHEGRPGDAIAWCDRGFQASRAVRDAAYLFPFLPTGARAYLLAGDPAGARDWVSRTAPLVVERSIAGTLPAVDHAWGLVSMAERHPGKARARLAAAAAGWLRHNRFWEGTHALVDQAQAAHRSRRPGEASALLASARERATTVGAAPLLARCAAVNVRDAAPAQPLTARELEVAQLIATGATNREIAAALTIAPKTAAAHVEHILTKLGVGRRAEIAAWISVLPRGHRDSSRGSRR